MPTPVLFGIFSFSDGVVGYHNAETQFQHAKNNIARGQNVCVVSKQRIDEIQFIFGKVSLHRLVVSPLVERNALGSRVDKKQDGRQTTNEWKWCAEYP